MYQGLHLPSRHEIGRYGRRQHPVPMCGAEIGPLTPNPAGTYSSANITVNAQGLVTAASNGSGGGGLSDFLHFDEMMADNLATLTEQTGFDVTNGVRFRVDRSGVNCTGATFYWNTASEALTIKLWRVSDSAELASASVASSVVGSNSVTFGAPVALARNKGYVISLRQTNRQISINLSGISVMPLTGAVVAGNVAYDLVYYYQSGNNYPSSTINSFCTPIHATLA